MNDHQRQVARFFNRAAAHYRNRTEAPTARYFRRRLDLALRPPPEPEARILDLGCGRGHLYQRLWEAGGGQNYLGIDLSQAMLDRSGIPTGQRRLADFFSLDPSEFPSFDYVYALGFTTYLAPEQLACFYASLPKLLSPNGRAVISYTNGAAYDLRLRRAIRQTIGGLIPDRYSLGRDFSIYAPRLTEEIDRLPPTLRAYDRAFLPPAVPLLARLLGDTDTPLARWDERWRPDFLLYLRRV